MFAAVVVVCLKVSTPGVPVDCRIRHRVFDTERACVAFVDRLRLQAIPERFAVDVSCTPFNRQV